MAENESIYESFMYGGFYRVDLRDNLSILVLNSMYMDSDDDTSYQAEEGWNQLKWLEDQLIQGKQTGRKFLIADHVYAGARYEGDHMWHEDFSNRYF